MKKKQEIRGKELLNAFVNSNKSLYKIPAFMNENEDEKS